VSDDHGEILGLVNSRLPLPLVYAGIRQILSKRMPAANMFVSLLEGEGLRFPYYQDEFEPEDTLDIFTKEGWTGYVIDLQSRYWLSRDPAPPPGISPIGHVSQDWLGVPLIDRDGSTMGVLAVQTYELGSRYTDEDERFVQFTASALSVAIQLARQDADIAVRRIAALVDDIVDLEDLYPRIHQILKKVIPAAEKNIVFARVDTAAGLFLPVYWMDEREGYQATNWLLDQGFSGYISTVTGKSFIFEKGRTVIPPEVIPIVATPLYWLGAPLVSQNRIIGIVFIQSYNVNTIITREDEYVLNSICPYIAEAISHTELFSLKLRKS
jgi:GAF domain-containing protein